MRSTGYASPIKHDAPLWLVGVQQLWLAHFDSRCYDELFPRRSTVASHGFPVAACFLIVDIHASRISIPLSRLMLLGWSLTWQKWEKACGIMRINPKRVASGVVGVLWYDGGLGTGELDVPVMFLDSVLLRSSSLADVDRIHRKSCKPRHLV